MVFQRANPFPLSIYDNVTYGLKVHGIRDKSVVQARSGTQPRIGPPLDGSSRTSFGPMPWQLSGEQQQRLCIARVVAVEPEILLMDEPCSALDPIATSRIEELMYELEKKYTIVIVTHNMQQAARVSGFTGYFLLGELVEFDETDRIFTNPSDPRTEDYITGRFG